jgi:hypothetical protein
MAKVERVRTHHERNKWEINGAEGHSHPAVGRLTFRPRHRYGVSRPLLSYPAELNAHVDFSIAGRP